MVRQYYVGEITDISEQELRPLCQTVKPPAEPLLGNVFTDDAAESLTSSRSWDLRNV